MNGPIDLHAFCASGGYDYQQQPFLLNEVGYSLSRTHGLMLRDLSQASHQISKMKFTSDSKTQWLQDLMDRIFNGLDELDYNKPQAPELQQTDQISLLGFNTYTRLHQDDKEVSINTELAQPFLRLPNVKHHLLQDRHQIAFKFDGGIGVLCGLHW